MMRFGSVYAQSLENSPLTVAEGRAILGQLYELRSLRQEVAVYQNYVERDHEQAERERDNSARALELERQAARLVSAERDLWKERAELYQTMYAGITAPPSFGCRFIRAITIGIYKCR